ncbi:carbohydrate kinase family protein [Bacteriovorax sp. DB6_IX]|uniref:carbohydrate kinase family protein n=1 Tax=Bacteriovorax sp. DB6_IX TaxID=1353530 RepID=UPI00038A0EE9|nr:PfkB family carbohydrate kinase [Bacteriovorax sp. DB6_IX]EQC51620.1 carbohydrate kinase, PfkB domain protein [Bacteriovorax sp. DB6_IX]
MAKVLCLGDVCIDIYPQKNKSFLGGCSYNVAYHLINEFDIDATLMAPLGHDKWSAKIVSKINSMKIPFKALERDYPNLTLGIVVSDGERYFRDYQDEIIQSFEWRDSELSLLADYDYIICPYFEEIREFIAPVIALYAEKVILDIHDAVGIDLDELSRLISVVKGIQIGGDLFGKSDLERLSAENRAFISVTQSVKGSMFYCVEKVSHYEAVANVEVIDTTGAGDSYLAALVSGMVKGLPMEQVGGMANSFAAKTISHIGATPMSEITF